MKINKLVMFISIVFLSLLVIGAASAADDVADDSILAVDDAPDDVVASDEPVEKSFTDLRKDTEDKQTVELTSDYKYNESVDTLADPDIDKNDYANNTNRYESGIYIVDDCTIDGKGHYIDGAGVTTVFKILNGATVNLKNIEFKNSPTAIYSSGELILDNCTFVNVTTPVSDINVPVVAIIDDEASFADQLSNPNSAFNRYYYVFPRFDCTDAQGNIVSPYKDKTTLVTGHSLKAAAIATFPWISIDVGTDFVGDVEIYYNNTKVFIYNIPAPKAFGYLMVSVPNDCGLEQFRLNKTDASKPKDGEGKDISLDPSKLQVVLCDDSGNTTYDVTSVYKATKTKYAADLEITKAKVNDYGVIEISAAINKEATGNVTYKIFSKQGLLVGNKTAEIINGEIEDYGELETFDKGVYTIVVSYEGDEVFSAAEVNTTVEVSKEVPVVTDNVTVSYNNVVFVFEFPADATGNVTIYYLNDDTNETSSIENGKVSFDNFFEAGSYSVLLGYDGDDNYYGIFDYYVDFFIKEDVNLDADAEVNDNLVGINATVNETATGNITFIIINDETTEVVENVTVKIENVPIEYSFELPKGDYTYRVEYSGDDVFYDSEVIGDVKVTKEDPVLEITYAKVNEYGSIEIAAYINKNATGNVTYLIFSEEGLIVGNKTVEIIDGEIEDYSELQTFAKGLYKIGVFYDGDANFIKSQIYSSVNVTKVVPVVTDNVTVSYNQVTIVFEFPADATGNVTVYLLDYGTNETLSIENGKVLFDDFFNEGGNHSVLLTYDGDDNYYGIYNYYVDFSVKESPDLDADAEVNDNLVGINATVNETATGNITFIICDENDKVVKNETVEIENGAAAYSVVLPKGDYTYRVEYLGDDVFYDSVVSGVFNITKEDPVLEITYAKVNEYGSIEIAAYINKNATGNVTYWIYSEEGLIVGNKTVEIIDGEIEEYSELETFAKGLYYIDVLYDGDANFIKADVSSSVNVTKEVPVVTDNVTVSYNQVTIVFEFPANATGNVTVYLLDYGTNETLSIENGKVLFDDFFNEGGNHSVLLTYAGDDNYYGIFDHYVDFSVKESPDLDADAEVNDNLVGINATVNKTATGNITFIIYDENDVAVKNVTVEIEFGAANYSWELPKGDYTYNVEYSGDDVFYDSVVSGVFNVTKEDPVLEITYAKVNEYGSIEIAAYINKNATGNVTYLIFSEEGLIVGNKTVEIIDGEIEDYSELQTFAKGSYKIGVFYDGDANFIKSEAYSSVNVTKEVPVVTDNVTVSYNQATIVFEFPTNATGNVTVFCLDYGTNVTLPIENGTVLFDDIFDSGTHSVLLTYDGDDNYYGIYNHYVDFIIQDNANLTVAYAVDEFGNLIMVAQVNENATGYITFVVVDENDNVVVNVTKEVENGLAAQSVVLEKGNFFGGVVYSGDALYYDDVYTFEVNSTKSPSGLEITKANVNNYGIIEISAAINKNATGNVTYKIFSESGLLVGEKTVEIINGSIEDYAELETFAKGFYTIEVSYAGDANYYAAKDFDDAEVTKDVPAVTEDVKVVANEAEITFHFPANATGNVTVFMLSYGTNVTLPITNGVVVFDEIFDNGDQSVLLGYDGDANYYGIFDHYVDFFVKTSSFVTVKDVSVVYNKNAKVTVTLTNNDDGKGNKPVAKAQVIVAVNGKEYKGTTDAKGIAVISIPAKFVPKTYKAKATYKGTATCYGDYADFKFTVKKATPKITAKKKTFKASKKTKKYTITLKDNNKKAIKKAKVTLKVKGKTYKAKTNSKGKATFKITKLNKKGTYKAKITYKGNKYFKKATKSVKIKVKK